MVNQKDSSAPEPGEPRNQTVQENRSLHWDPPSSSSAPVTRPTPMLPTPPAIEIGQLAQTGPLSQWNDTSPWRPPMGSAEPGQRFAPGVPIKPKPEPELQPNFELEPDPDVPTRESPLPVRKPRPAPHHRRRNLALAGGAGALVLVLAAGLAFALLGRDDSGSDQEPAALSAPFLEAVRALQDAPGVSYRDGVLDVRITRDGDLTGSFGYEDTPIARTDEGTFARLSRADVLNVLPYLDPAGVPARSWVQIDGADLSDLDLDHLAPASPQAMAERTLAVLNQPGTSFTPSSSEEMLNGTPALIARTSAGPVYVTRSSPHRLLHLPTTLFTGEPAPASERSDQAPVSYSESTSGPAPQVSVFDGVALSELSTDQVREAYDELIDQTGQLKNALDAQVAVTTGELKHECTADQCTLSTQVTVNAAAGGPAAAVSRVALRATFRINDDGAKAGRCTAVVSIKQNDTKTLSCSTTSTAQAMQTALANAHARANERSLELGGAAVSYEVPYRSSGEVVGLAQIDVKQSVSSLLQRRSEFATGD
ncbi:hypothetical protein GCM10027456_72360 [Kineosporia babensis]